MLWFLFWPRHVLLAKPCYQKYDDIVKDIIVVIKWCLSYVTFKEEIGWLATLQRQQTDKEIARREYCEQIRFHFTHGFVFAIGTLLIFQYRQHCKIKNSN